MGLGFPSASGLLFTKTDGQKGFNLAHIPRFYYRQRKRKREREKERERERESEIERTTFLLREDGINVILKCR